ncbi:hypothetical protein ACSNN5_08735 [Brevibacillus formosus]
MEKKTNDPDPLEIEWLGMLPGIHQNAAASNKDVKMKFCLSCMGQKEWDCLF